MAWRAKPRAIFHGRMLQKRFFHACVLVSKAEMRGEIASRKEPADQAGLSMRNGSIIFS
jgi:hypothetical protein